MFRVIHYVHEISHGKQTELNKNEFSEVAFFMNGAIYKLETKPILTGDEDKRNIELKEFCNKLHETNEHWFAYRKNNRI